MTTQKTICQPLLAQHDLQSTVITETLLFRGSRLEFLYGPYRFFYIKVYLVGHGAKHTCSLREVELLFRGCRFEFQCGHYRFRFCLILSSVYSNLCLFHLLLWLPIQSHEFISDVKWLSIWWWLMDSTIRTSHVSERHDCIIDATWNYKSRIQKNITIN